MIGLRLAKFLTFSLLISSTLAEYEVMYNQKKMKRVAKSEWGKKGCCTADTGSCDSFDNFCHGDVSGCPPGTMTWITDDDNKKWTVVESGTCNNNSPMVNNFYAYSCFTCPTGYKPLVPVNDPCLAFIIPPQCQGCTSKDETLVLDPTTGTGTCSGSCKLGKDAQTWLKAREGFKANFYNDTSKPPKRTIGWGHNCDAHKDCDKITEPVDATSAGKLFSADVAESIAKVRTLANVDLLNYNQFVVLTSWAYNYGNVLVFQDLMAAGNIQGVLDYMQQVYDSTTDDGLKNRRGEELKKFKTETTTKSGCTHKA